MVTLIKMFQEGRPKEREYHAESFGRQGSRTVPAPAPSVYLGEVQVRPYSLQEGEAGDELLPFLPGLADGHGPLLKEEAGRGGQGGHSQGGQGGGQAAPGGQQNLIEGRVGMVKKMVMMRLMIRLMIRLMRMVRISKRRLVHLEAHGHIVLPQQQHVLPELFIPLALEGQG